MHWCPVLSLIGWQLESSDVVPTSVVCTYFCLLSGFGVVCKSVSTGPLTIQ